MKQKIYYHVMEENNTGDLGWQGAYETENEADESVKHLENTFEDLYFWVFISNSNNEPPITTV